MSALGKGSDVKVSQFFTNVTWNLPLPSSVDLILAWHNIINKIEPAKNFPDQVVWIAENNGKFSLKSAYYYAHHHHLYVQPDWVNWIWFKGCIKKFSFCVWMIFKSYLKTKAFLMSGHVDCVSRCNLCDCPWESTVVTTQLIKYDIVRFGPP